MTRPTQERHDRDAAREDLRALLKKLRRRMWTVTPGDPSTYLWNVVEIGEPVSVARLRSWETREWVEVEVLKGGPKRRVYRLLDGWNGR